MRRLEGLKDTGVTTVEIKSGYGLDHDSELKMLRVARRIGRDAGVRVRTSYLGLHAVPPEHKADRAVYVDKAVDEILPAAHAEGLVDAVDAYCQIHCIGPGRGFIDPTKEIDAASARIEANVSTLED
ncbi:hypothetical protein LTR94_033142, partial [Friedmanniomyces endolithicus]